MAEQLCIILGCFGRRDDDFVSCAGVRNSILKTHPGLFKYNEMMDYLEVCRLFDKPLFDYNAIRHCIFNLQAKFDQPTKKLWTEKQFNLFQKFTIDHRNCGLFIELDILEAAIEKPEKEELILIESLEESNKINNLRYLKGKR